MLFTIIFTLNILILTTSQNRFFTIIINIFFFTLLIINKKKKKILSLIVTIILAVSAVLIKNYNYINKITINTNYYIGTGIILEKYNREKYLIQIGKSTFLLKSDIELKNNQIVFLNGYISPLIQKKDLKIQNSPPSAEEIKNFLQNKEIKFNYKKRLIMKNFYGVIYPKKIIKTTEKQANRISKIRKEIKKFVIKNFDSKNSALVLGMLTGDKSLFTKKLYQNFINSGLVHIVAVSGSNIVIITIFLSIILFFVPFYIRYFIILIGIIFYTILCGFDSSIVRASIMASLTIFTIFLGTELATKKILGIARNLMLFLNPYFLSYDIGFLLSFFAIFGLIILGNFLNNFTFSINNRKKITAKFFETLNYFLKNILYPTISASFGVIPILIFFVNKRNLFSIIPNLLVIPIIGITTILGFLNFLIYKLNIYFLQNFLLNLQSFLSNKIILISQRGEKHSLYITFSNTIYKNIFFGIFIFRLIYIFTNYEFIDKKIIKK